MAKILIETSARHVHVTEETLQILFGAGHPLTVKKMLSQPGQFAAVERVDVIGPKNSIKNVTIIGPVRKYNQVELSLSDARTVGVSAPIRESGDISASSPIHIVGPCGEVELTEGCIAAMRHIHLTPKEAEEFGLDNGQIVSVKVEGTGRACTFGDVVVRVNDNFAPAMHIDTDEANAACLSAGVFGEIIK